MPRVFWAQPNSTSESLFYFEKESDLKPFFVFNSNYIRQHNWSEITVSVSIKPDYKKVSSETELWRYSFDTFGRCVALSRYIYKVKKLTDSTHYYWYYNNHECIAQRMLKNSVWNSIYWSKPYSDSVCLAVFTEEVQNPFNAASVFPFFQKNSFKDSIRIQWISDLVKIETIFNAQRLPYKEVITRYHSDKTLKSRQEYFVNAPWMRQEWSFERQQNQLKKITHRSNNGIETHLERRFYYDSKGCLEVDSVFSDHQLIQQSLYIKNEDSIIKSVIIQSLLDLKISLFTFKFKKRLP